jgi:quercetin dioxygenase-like cupin family protein
MTKWTINILIILSALALGHCGCATSGSRQSPERDAIPVAGKELIRSTRSWDGELLPGYPAGQPEVTIRRITIPAGARLETHHHPVINAGILLSGQLTVVSGDGKTLELKAGDPIVELVNKPHYGVNRGKTPAEIVVIYAGAIGHPITVVEPR